MRVSTPKSLFAILALAVASLIAPFAHADTYQIITLRGDNTQFYGMTDTGAATFYASGCVNFFNGCYLTYVDGTLTSQSAVAPSAGLDDTPSHCNYAALPCSATDNGFTATFSRNPTFGINLFASNGSNPPQLVTTGGLAGVFAINGVGDIVFDNGSQDYWEEAIDLTTSTAAGSTVPEPASLLLLATGIFALGFTLKMGGITH